MAQETSSFVSGRLQQGNGEPGNVESFDFEVPEWSSQHRAEPWDNSFNRQSLSSTSQQQTSLPVPINEKMTVASDRTEPPVHNGISPELVEHLTEQITERVKKDLVEHFRQTANKEILNIDESPNSTPMHRAPSNKSSSTPSPPSTAHKVCTPPSPAEAPKQQANISFPPMDPVTSPPGSPLEKPSGVRFSDREPRTRPAGASRSYSNLELSTIDKRWGRLFDSEGDPTERLGQILRGLANHIIDDFMPRKSIVISPAKMAVYYSSHKLENEIHPLTTIFGSQSNDQVSRLYRDLGCQHHLIQEDVRMDPNIPALTPVGFAHWMTIFILSYPEEETKRLQKVVEAMPIDADGEMVDGKPERLPKQISRHLLPPKEDRKSRKHVEKAISEFFEDLEPNTPRRSKRSITSPPLSRTTSSSQTRTRPIEVPQPKISPTEPKIKPLERERMPYSGSPSALDSTVVDETIKIERERHPYTAQPGAGKVHTESVNHRGPSRHYRANSTSRVTRHPLDIGTEPRHQRTQSTASQNYTPVLRPGGRRTSSPPLKSFSNSDPHDIDAGSTFLSPPFSSMSSSYGAQSQTFMPSFHASTTSFPPPPPPLDIRDPRDGKRRDDRSHRRGTDDDEKFTGEFSSPREAERWERLQDLSRGVDSERPERTYEPRGTAPIDPRDLSKDSRNSLPIDTRDPRTSMPMDPRDLRSSLPYEDYHHGTGKGGGYDDYSGRRY